MTVRTEKELQALQRIGKICAQCVEHMATFLEPGITSKELDAIGSTFLANAGAKSAPILIYDFPGTTCISINEVAAHGIPDDRPILAGDIVNIDVSAELDGFFGDTGASYAMPPVETVTTQLFAATRRALDKAIAQVSAGRLINVIGKTVEREAKQSGFQVLRNLNGHGVGRSIHEAPEGIHNYDDPRDRRRLQEGAVITIEPFLTTGARNTTTGKDGWALMIPKGQKVAQYEHTMVVTKGKPIILTAA